MDLAIPAEMITIVNLYPPTLTKLANQEFASNQTALSVQIVVNALPVCATARCALRLQARVAAMELN